MFNLYYLFVYCFVDCYVIVVCFIADDGKCAVFSDSIPARARKIKCVVRAFPGATILGLTDRIISGEVGVRGLKRILLHVGINDINNLIDKKKHRADTIFQVMDRFKALRDAIRRRNSSALLLVSSILPRRSRYYVFRPYIQGLNFALEKWCAKSKHTVFIPSYQSFLSQGQPIAALYSERDGLHLSKSGVEKLEACFQQAFSTGYLLTRVTANRVGKLASLE